MKRFSLVYAHYISPLLFLGLLIAGPSVTEAATIFITPKEGKVPLGETINIEVRINSQEKGFNAAQSTIIFPTETLEIVSVDVSPNASIFNFWLEEPKFSNEQGTLSFVGGTTNGVVAASTQILSVIFRAKSLGEATIVPSDTAITASDGSGANIFTEAQVSVLEVVSAQRAQQNEREAEIPEVPIRRIVTRKPVDATTLPNTPKVVVPLYANSKDSWSNVTSSFLAHWQLPLDISNVATAINSNPTSEPPKAEGLFDAKRFPPLEDGVQYLHVQFKNSKGWGSTAHHRIAIDTTPPLPFLIDVFRESGPTDPSPSLTFFTDDALSGMDDYKVWINDVLVSEGLEGRIQLAPLTPGVHYVVVRAVDKAGNSREAYKEIIVDALSLPVLAAVEKTFFVGENLPELHGVAQGAHVVRAIVKDEDDLLVTEAEALVAEDGTFFIRLDYNFKKGVYIAEVRSEDLRGAQSFPAFSDVIKIREMPVLVLFGIGVTQLWFFVLLLALILVGGSFFWFSQVFLKQKIKKRIVMTARDSNVIFNMLKEDIDDILETYQDHRITKNEAKENEKILNKILKDLERSRKYMKENMRELFHNKH